MNLNILTTNVMLAQSKQWLTEQAIRVLIEQHPLGAALIGAIRKAHDRLALQAERRRQLAALLARLTRLISATDLRHDRKARALHGALQSLIEAIDDDELRNQYMFLLELLFPEGLAIVNRSFAYEAGAAEALENRMTPEIYAQLESIALGGQTLARVYREWVEAGNELGKLVAERDRMVERNGRGGSASYDMDIRAARLQWINTVHTFVSALELTELGQDVREAVLSPLAAAIAQALRGRDGEPGEEPGDGEPGDGDAALPPAGGVVVAPATPAPGAGSASAPPAA
jgi:hypothetical protein